MCLVLIIVCSVLLLVLEVAQRLVVLMPLRVKLRMVLLLLPV